MAGQESDFAQENPSPKSEDLYGFSTGDDFTKSNGIGSASIDEIRSLDDYKTGLNQNHLPEFSFTDLPRSQQLDEEGEGPLTRENARWAAHGWAASYDAAMRGDERSQKAIYEIAAQWNKLPQDSKMRQYVSQILVDMAAINPKANAAFQTAMEKGAGSIDFPKKK